MKNYILRARFLVLPFVAAAIFSCENPTEIGFDFSGDSLSQTIYSDTLNLDVSTVLADSSVNNNAIYILSGKTNDPVFGGANAEAYFQPTLANLNTGVIDTFKVASNAVADSLLLRIVNTGLIFGDTLFKSQFGLYRLKSPMQQSKNYNGDQKIEYDPTPIIKFNLTSSTFRGPKGDTIKALFLKLPIDLAQEILKVGNTPQISKSEFIEALKGFAIVPDANARAIYTFNTGVLNARNCYLALYWHNQGETSARSYLFEFSGPRHTGFDFDRSGTALSSLTKNNNELKSTNKTYVQSGSGISSKINLDKINSLGSNLKISSAQLVFELDKKEVDNSFAKAVHYTLAEIDSKNQQLRTIQNFPAYIAGTTLAASGALFTLVDSTNTLTTDITYYLQNKLNKGQKPGSIILLSSIPTTNTGFGIASNDHLRRAVFTKPKLKIYYTRSK